MARSKTNIRNMKAKGAGFEYDCQYSLSKLYPEIYRTSERGFQLQYDLECDDAVFECKRLKGISWNQANTFFDKLREVAPEDKDCYLLFKSNRQPCLVMYLDYKEDLIISDFETCFGSNIHFEKHPSTRTKRT